MDIVFARTTAVAGHVTVMEGTHWPANDPIVQAFPSLFTDDPRHGLMFSTPPIEQDGEETGGPTERQQPVEQATKAPGEKRTTRRAR